MYHKSRANNRSLHRGELLLFAMTGGIFLLLAIAGYAVLPPLPEKNPPRILFSTPGGAVVFNHHFHYNEDEAAFDCADCHHNEEADTSTLAGMECRSCHYENPDVVEAVCADDATHPRCIGTQCLACHDGEECTFCHRKLP